MKENKDRLKEMAHNALNQFEAKPPEGMWDRIQSAMQRKRRRILIFRYSAIAASLLLFLSLGISYFDVTDLVSNHKPVIADKTEIKKEINQSTNSKGNKSTVKLPASKQIQVDKQQNAKNITGKTINNTQNSKTDYKKYNSAKKIEIGDKTQTARLNISQETNQHSDKITRLRAKNETLSYSMLKRQNFTMALLPLPESDSVNPVFNLPTNLPDQSITTTSKDDKWDLAVNYGVTSGADFSQNGESMNTDRSSYSHDEFSAYLANETSYFEEIQNTVHDAPLTLGITVDKGILPRLSFETGLLYTKLGFRVKTDEMSSFYSEYRNQIHYLGIPAGIRYSFMQRKRFDLYALQWFILEKGIAGRWYVNDYGNNILLSSETNHHSIRGIQFSSLTGVGGQIRLAHPFYLFGQAGVQAFFLNKTQPYNIRSAHIAWPSFQVGLRIGL